MDKTRLFIIGVIVAIFFIVVLFLYGFIFGRESQSPFAVEATLSFWGVEDDGSAYANAISSFKNTYPNVSITYRSFINVVEYERALLDALAAGRGPDIFVLRNNDLFRKIDKIAPLPADKYTLLDLQRDFPEVVARNFVQSNSIYALPASIDTLALIFNRDLFNEAAVVFAPKTWDELKELVPELTKRDDEGAIVESAVALGTADNNRRAKDILSLLMLQSGVSMVADNYSGATFATQGGTDALRLYMEFSNPSLDTYTWDSSMPDAFEAFAGERVAMVLGYARDVKGIKNQNPFINLEIAPVPNLSSAERRIAFANFLGYTVSRQSRYQGIAWDFVLHLTTNQSVARSYLAATSKPPALRSLISQYINDPNLNVFARQALTANSWQEPDPERVDEIFKDAINAVLNKNLGVSEALTDAQKKISGLMRR